MLELSDIQSSQEKLQDYVPLLPLRGFARLAAGGEGFEAAPGTDTSVRIGD